MGSKVLSALIIFLPIKFSKNISDSLEACQCPWIGHRGRGRPRFRFVDNLLIYTGVETNDKLDTLMLDRMVQRRVILDPRAAPADPT